MKTDSLYCLFLANKLLSTDPIDIGYHYHQVNDGRHRACITSRLKTKGAVVVFKEGEPTAEECRDRIAVRIAVGDEIKSRAAL